MTVYQRSGSRFWTMNLTYRGVRVNRSTRKTTEEEARQVEENTRREIDEELGSLPQALEMPVEQSGEDLDLLYLMEDKEPEIATLTFQDAIKRAYIEKFKSNTDGDITYRRLVKVSNMIQGDRLLVKNITKKHILYITKRLREERLAEATVNRYLAHVRTVLYLAMDEWEIIDRVPKFHLTREKEGRLFFFTQKQERELIDWYIANGHQLEADLIAVLFDTGLRMGEALKMQYDRNVDIAHARISLTANICKSGKPRTIPLTERALFILKKIRHLNQGVHNKPFGGIGYNAMQKRNIRARQELGLPDEAVFHACRHTCATRLIENGIDIRTVQEWLGHSSITTTERYVKTTGQRLELAARTLEPVANVAS